MLLFDVEESRLVFVKDYWRPVESDKEGDVYHRRSNLTQSGSAIRRDPSNVLRGLFIKYFM